MGPGPAFVQGRKPVGGGFGSDEDRCLGYPCEILFVLFEWGAGDAIRVQRKAFLGRKLKNDVFASFTGLLGRKEATCYALSVKAD